MVSAKTRRYAEVSKSNFQFSILNFQLTKNIELIKLLVSARIAQSEPIVLGYWVWI